MRLWNFVHNRIFFITRYLHFWEFIALVIVALMIISAIIHYYKHKKREEDYEDELKEIIEAHAAEQIGIPETEGEKQ